jgi:hypothetical protein
MQYIEIKIVDKRFLMMGDGDPVKQMAERSAALEEIKEKARQKELSGGYQYGEVSNPFPQWLRVSISSAACDFRSKEIYHDENAVYRVEIEGDRSEFDKFYGRLNEIVEGNLSADAVEWRSKNHVHVTSTPDDEDEAMRDLESYQQGSPRPVQDGADKRKKAV